MSIQIMDLLLAFLALPCVLASAYLAALALLAVMPLATQTASGATPQRRFAIIIPAHNEADRLPRLLASLAELDYPRRLIEIVVVADNCDDQTAEVARDGGAAVAERHAAERGKGFALATGLRHAAGAFDAVVFVDADCIVSSNMLQVFSAVLDRGEHVAQARYVMEARGDASHQALRRLALALVHLVRPLGKTRIGASAGLKGSGMCFTRDVVEDVGWWATGLAEDTEQHARLVEAGLRVAFTREVVVTGEQPASLRDATEQHRRWEAGRSEVARKGAVSLALRGVRSRSIPMVDAAVELAIPPVSILLFVLIAVLVAGLVLAAQIAAALGLIGLALLGGYFLAGVILSASKPMDILRAVASIPAYAAWKTWLYARSLVSPPEAWERTRRDPS